MRQAEVASMLIDANLFKTVNGQIHEQWPASVFNLVVFKGVASFYSRESLVRSDKVGNLTKGGRAYRACPR
jgi:hypothetical protein